MIFSSPKIFQIPRQNSTSDFLKKAIAKNIFLTADGLKVLSVLSVDLSDIGKRFGIGLSGVNQASRRRGLKAKKEKKLGKVQTPADGKRPAH